MIDPKELRIGNYIDCANQNRIIEQIGGRLIALLPNSESIICVSQDTALNPIPLTNEILLKTGFQYNETDEEYTIGSIGFEASEEDVDRHFSLADGGKIFELWSENKKDFECYFSNIPIKSVHQLQNLYFALTGEELEIKL